MPAVVNTKVGDADPASRKNAPSLQVSTPVQKSELNKAKKWCADLGALYKYIKIKFILGYKPVIILDFFTQKIYS